MKSKGSQKLLAKIIVEKCGVGHLSISFGLRGELMHPWPSPRTGVQAEGKTGDKMICVVGGALQGEPTNAIISSICFV